jgi:hypothetical protein
VVVPPVDLLLVCGGLGIRVYRVVLASVDLVLVVADSVMVTVWISHSGGVVQEGC